MPCPWSVQIGTAPSNIATYSWTPTTGLSDPYISNPTASPASYTTYNVTALSTVNEFINGDFALGNVSFGSDYSNYVPGNGISTGQIAVGTNPHDYNTQWCSILPPDEPNILIVDGAQLNSQGNIPIFWRQTLAGIQIGKTYRFSIRCLSLAPGNSGPAAPNIEIIVNGAVFYSFPLTYNNCHWVTVNLTMTFTTENPTIELRDANTELGNNDFAVDDISLRCFSTDEVNVIPCLPVAITSASYFEYGACSPTAPANAAIPIGTSSHYCYYWECGGFAHFYSNLPNNNQWYVNDNLITTSGYSPNGYFNIANASELIIGGPAGANYSFKVQLKNPTYGSNTLTSPTYVYLAPNWGTTESGGDYKQNYTKTFDPNFINHGPNAIYTWSIPGCTLVDANPNDPAIQIYFPSTVPTNIHGTLTITNSYCDKVVNVTFFYNVNAKNLDILTRDIKIYPNPAYNILNLSSTKENITGIDITDLFGTFLKKFRFKTSKSVSVNVSNFRIGVYNCRIYTENGVENQKLIIKR